MKNALVNLVNISKSFDNQMVLDDLNLYIRENEFLTPLGPSGCGMRTCSKSGSRADGARSSNSELPIANLQFRVYILVVILA